MPVCEIHAQAAPCGPGVTGCQADLGAGFPGERLCCSLMRGNGVTLSAGDFLDWRQNTGRGRRLFRCVWADAVPVNSSLNNDLQQVPHQAGSVRNEFDSFASLKQRTAVSNLSRHPGLQNPTTRPSCTVSESACTGLPDHGHTSFMQSAISRPDIPVPPLMFHGLHGRLPDAEITRQPCVLDFPRSSACMVCAGEVRGRHCSLC